MITPNFQTTYAALRKQLSETDYLTKYNLLGAKIQDKEPIIPFDGTPYRIARSGVMTLAGGKINPALEARCRRLNETLHADNTTAYDLGMQFYALPRIPVILCFNDSDAEFPAQFSILFRRPAELFLDLQSLCVCAAFLAGSLIGELTSCCDISLHPLCCCGNKK
jgi:hypothetical protein